MKTNKKPWPLGTLSNAKGIRQRIDTNPDFQRPAVWTTAQKQLLIVGSGGLYSMTGQDTGSAMPNE